MRSTKELVIRRNIVMRLLSITIATLLIITSFIVVFVEPVKADFPEIYDRAIPGFNAWEGNNSLAQFTQSIINNTDGTDSFYYGNTTDISFNGTIVGANTCYLYYPQYNTTLDGGNYEVWTNWSRYSGTSISSADLTLEGVTFGYSGLWLLLSYDTATLWQVNMSNMTVYDSGQSQWEDIIGWFWVNSSYGWTANLSRNAVFYDNNDTMSISVYDSGWNPVSSCFIDVWKIDSQAPGEQDYQLAYHKQVTTSDNGVWNIDAPTTYSMTHDLGLGEYYVYVYEDEDPGHDISENIYGTNGTLVDQGTKGYNNTFGYTNSNNWSGRFIDSGLDTQIRSWDAENVSTYWNDSNGYGTTYRWETCGPFNPPEHWINFTILNVVTKNATLKGYVNDSEGQGIEDVNITASLDAMGIVNFTSSLADGYYELNLTSGVYNISYMRDMYYPNWSDEVIAYSATNWTNVSLEGGDGGPGGPGGGMVLNEWNSELTPRYITNQTSEQFMFTLLRGDGWESLRLNNLTISLSDNLIYSENNGNLTSLADSDEYSVNHTSNYIKWTKNNTDGFSYASSENFGFLVDTNGALGTAYLNVSAESNSSEYTNISFTVFITTNFSFTGSVYDIDGNALEGAVGSMTIQSFTSGPPIDVGIFSDSTNTTGHFNITNIPTTQEGGGEPGGPGGPGGGDLFYKLSAAEYAPGTPYAINISASLPSVGYSEISWLLNNPEMYLRRAISFKVQVIGPNYNWSNFQIENYSYKNFQVMAKDLALGFPVKENTTQASEQIFSVPANRNYSFSIFPDQSFPVSVRFTDITARCQASEDLNETGVNVTYTAYNGTYALNVTVNASSTERYINGTFTGVTEIDQMAVVAYVMEDQDMVFENWALPYNLGNQSGGPMDYYDNSTGEYNISLPATQASSYILLRAYAVNTSGLYYMDSYIVTASGGSLSTSIHNFSMSQMIEGSSRGIISNNVSAQWNETTVMNTTAVQFYFYNSTGSQLTTESPFIEIKRELDGTEYMQMIDASNGLFNVSLIQGESIKKLTVFTQQYAPVSTPVSASVLSGASDTTSIDCFNGVCNITLRSFGEYDPFNQSQDFSMGIYKSNASCNVPNPPDYCDLCGGTMDESEFSPFNAILKGDINMMITSGDISVYYINVDLLASGPPDASFTESGTEAAGGLEAAWQFGSQGPDIYDYVIIGMPYNSSLENKTITVKIQKLYDNEFDVIWNQSAGNTSDDIENDAALFEYRDYVNSTYPSYISGTEAYLNGTGVVCSESNPNLQSGLGYKDTDNGTIWIKIPHFSGVGPTIFGENSYPSLSGESPTNGSNNSQLYTSCNIVVSDSDGDLLTVTIYENTTGNWVLQQTNTSVSSGTNVSWANFSNASSYSTTYNWSVNVTDSYNWTNATYSFTTRSQYLPDPPTSLSATSTGTSSISLSWTKDNRADYTRVQGKSGGYPTSISDGSDIYNSTGSSTSDSSLSSSTTYYYRAWSWNSTGELWSLTYASSSATTDTESSSPGGNGDDTTTTDDAPTISNVAHTPTTVTSSDTVTVSATVTDDNTVSSVRLYWNDDTEHSKSMSASGSNYSATIGPFTELITVTYWINATDNASQSTESSTSSFTVSDTSGPTITIVSPGSDDIIVSTTPTVKATYTDPSGIDTSSVTLTIDESSVTSATITSSSITYTPNATMAYGSHTVKLVVSDTLGYNGTKEWSFSIEEAESTSEEELGNVTSGEETEIIPENSEETGIDSIDFTPGANLTDVIISVAKLKEKPEDIDDVPTGNTTYIYLVLELTSNGSDVSEDDIETIKINFKVEKSWIEANDIDKEKVTLMRYKNGAWETLTTTYVSEDDTYVYYEAELSGFSTFAVVGEKIITIEPEEEPSPIMTYALIIAAVVAAIIILVFFLFKTGYLYVEEEKEEKPKEETTKKPEKKDEKKSTKKKK